MSYEIERFSNNAKMEIYWTGYRWATRWRDPKTGRFIKEPKRRRPPPPPPEYITVIGAVYYDPTDRSGWHLDILVARRCLMEDRFRVVEEIRRDIDAYLRRTVSPSYEDFFPVMGVGIEFEEGEDAVEEERWEAWR